MGRLTQVPVGRALHVPSGSHLPELLKLGAQGSPIFGATTQTPSVASEPAVAVWQTRPSVQERMGVQTSPRPGGLIQGASSRRRFLHEPSMQNSPGGQVTPGAPQDSPGWAALSQVPQLAVGSNWLEHEPEVHWL